MFDLSLKIAPETQDDVFKKSLFLSFSLLFLLSFSLSSFFYFFAFLFIRSTNPIYQSRIPNRLPGTVQYVRRLHPCAGVQERTTKARPAQLRRVAIIKSAPATSPVLSGQFDAAETRGACDPST
jgi:hypothetical protein